jgi:hypothetical protein
MSGLVLEAVLMNMHTGRVSTVTVMSPWVAFKVRKHSTIGRPICPAPQMAKDLYPDMESCEIE